MVIKFVYAIFLALLIALFVGLGISAFLSRTKRTSATRGTPDGKTRM